MKMEDGERKRYEQRFKDHGVSHVALQYSTEFRQQLMFDAVLRAWQGVNVRSILDVGCGFGDFLPYARGRLREMTRYVGVDLAQSFVNHAKVRFAEWDSVEFSCETITGDKCYTMEFDAAVAIATFTVKAEDTMKVLTEAMFNMLDAANKVVTVTLLTKSEPREEDFVMNIRQLAEWAETFGVERITIDRATLPYVAVVSWYKDWHHAEKALGSAAD